MALLHTCAGWPSIKDENYASTTQMTTANPWPLTLTFSVAHHPFVNLFSDYEKKKNYQHPAQSLSTSFSADALQEPRSLGIDQQGLGGATG